MIFNCEHRTLNIWFVCTHNVTLKWISFLCVTLAWQRFSTRLKQIAFVSKSRYINPCFSSYHLWRRAQVPNTHPFPANGLEIHIYTCDVFLKCEYYGVYIRVLFEPWWSDIQSQTARNCTGLKLTAGELHWTMEYQGCDSCSPGAEIVSGQLLFHCYFFIQWSRVWDRAAAAAHIWL